ncbi:MAG TPA: hypothetical protein VGG71_15710, partial [Chitinophagaceae bacterium]
AAHKIIENYIIDAVQNHDGIVQEPGQINATDDKIQNCVSAALKWMYEHNVVWQKTETIIYSKEYNYAGTMDGLALVDGIQSVVDWKSSNYLFCDYCYQVAAYQNAYEEEHGIEIKDRWILRLGKETSEFEPWRLTPDCFHDDFRGFTDCLRLSEIHKKVEARMKAIKPKKSRKTKVKANE